MSLRQKLHRAQYKHSCSWLLQHPTVRHWAWGIWVDKTERSAGTAPLGIPQLASWKVSGRSEVTVQQLLVLCWALPLALHMAWGMSFHLWFSFLSVLAEHVVLGGRSSSLYTLDCWPKKGSFTSVTSPAGTMPSPVADIC